MSAAPTSEPTIRCLYCGRLNPLGRKYCKNCKQELPDPPPIPPVPPVVDSPEGHSAGQPDPIPPSVHPEVEKLQASLHASQSETEELRQQFQSKQEELEQTHATHAGHVEVLTNNLSTAEAKATALESHKAGLEAMLKEAEAKAAELKADLIAKAKGLEDLGQQVQSKQEELDKAHATHAGHVEILTNNLSAAEAKATALETHKAGLEGMLNEAKAKATELEGKLADKAKEFEVSFRKHFVPMQEELNKTKDKANTLESQAAELDSKWKSAEARAVALEAAVAAKTKEINELKNNPVLSDIAVKANRRLKYIFGILTAVGSVGGYGAGRYIQPGDNSAGKVNQLATQVENTQQQIGNLNSTLKSATDKADEAQKQWKAELDAANQRANDLAAHEQELQRQLAAKSSAADQVRDQSKADVDSAAQKIGNLTSVEQQLRKQLSDALAQRTSVYNMIVQKNAELASLQAQLAPRGSLVWSGSLAGDRTIRITNGVPDYGTVNGALPQRPCKVSTQDAHVKIRTRPSKNHWNDLSFEVSGSGNVQIRIDWEVSE